jgi:NAD(P)H-dependent flavin oxidoreductase YrpB (nitropropane dioxygenase family)
MSSLPTRFTDRFGCEYPFACAGMGFAGETPDLAIAVSTAGGVGAIGVGFVQPEPLRAVIYAVRRAVGDSPFNINFLTIFDNDGQLQVCAEERVPIVSSTGDTRRPATWRCCEMPACRCGSRSAPRPTRNARPTTASR